MDTRALHGGILPSPVFIKVGLPVEKLEGGRPGGENRLTGGRFRKSEGWLDDAVAIFGGPVTFLGSRRVLPSDGTSPYEAGEGIGAVLSTDTTVG